MWREAWGLGTSAPFRHVPHFFRSVKRVRKCGAIREANSAGSSVSNPQGQMSYPPSASTNFHQRYEVEMHTQ